MLALPPLPARDVRLALFASGVATADAYRWLADSRPADRAPEPRCLSLGALASWDGVAALAHNDFEGVVLPRHRGAAAALGGMRADRGAAPGRIAMMSGSGATVFAIDDDSRAWDGGGDESGAGPRFVRTRTAAAVARVELLAERGGV
jgi:4-diphosphocytidyl-2C-methyl-D-erythritol kinase